MASSIGVFDYTHFYDYYIRLQPKTVIVLLGCLVVILLIGRLSNRPAYPPGPRGLPLLGNIFQLNHEAWVIFTKWKRQYGDLVHLNMAGQSVLVINGHKVASELLEKRANIYSDRPRFIVAGEILTGGHLLGLTRYGDLWRRLRRATHEALNTGVSSQYHPVQHSEAVLLAHGLLTDYENWYNHLLRTAASTITSMVYSSPPLQSAADPSISMINDLNERITRSAYPGAHLVEFFHFLQYVPRRFAKWRRDAEDWFQRYTELFEKYYGDIAARVRAGQEQSRNFCVTLAETKPRHNLTDREASWLAATMYVAGSETSASTLSWFLLAMVAFPEVQRKAQEELDEVVGRSRMPTFADREHLPYIRAIVKEVLRWRPAAPLGLPHYSVADDVYEGYFIPKGTICLANIWGMNSEPEIYGPDVNEFRPERFLEKNERLESIDTKEEGHVSFGFGRRYCVGRHVANNALFIDAALLLWALRFESGKDGLGQPIKPDIDGNVNEGLIVRPIPFKCIATPRYPEVASMLSQAREEILGL